jgi:hypothetical protein
MTTDAQSLLTLLGLIFASAALTVAALAGWVAWCLRGKQ